MVRLKPRVFSSAVRATAHSRNLGGTQMAGAFGFEKLLGNIIGSSPGTRLGMTPYSESRAGSERLASQAWLQKKNFRGGASDQSVETNFNREFGIFMGSSVEKLNDGYAQYRMRVAGLDPSELQGRRIQETVRRGMEDVGNLFAPDRRPYMTSGEFREQVSKIRRRLDEGIPVDAEPEAVRIAKEFGDEMFDPLFDRMEAAGMLTPGKRRTYLSQIWNLEKIQADSTGFIEFAREIFSRRTAASLAKNRAKLESLQNKIKTLKGKKRARARVTIRNLQDAIVRQEAFDPHKKALDFYNEILNSPFGMLDNSDDLVHLGKARFQKKRSIEIPMDMLEIGERYLENDIEKIAYSYNRTMLPRLLLREAFPGDDESLTKLLQRIRDEADFLIAQVEDPAAKAQLMRQKESDLRDLMALRDRLLGTYQLPQNPRSIGYRISRSLLRLNTVTMLGGVVLGSLPDAARLVARQGLRRTLGNLSKILSEKEFTMQSRRDLQRTVGIYEIQLQHRFFEQTEAHRSGLYKNRLEKAIESASDRFGQVSGISIYNQYMKTFTAFNAMDMILETAEKVVRGVDLLPIERLRMSENGLTDDMMRRIYANFIDKGQTKNGVRIAQSGDWEGEAGREAARYFNNALRREIDLTITTPGISSRPLWASSEIGKHIAQFQSFNFMATNAIALSGLQSRDKETVAGILLGIFMGTMVYSLREQIAGREPDYSPGNLAAEGIDRSGVLGWIMSANNLVEKASDGSIGINPLLSGSQTSRYRSRDIIQSIYGPSASTLGDIARAAGGVGNIPGLIGGVSADDQASFATDVRGDIHAFRSLVPGQNLFYLNFMFDAVENGVDRVLGVEQ